MRTTVACLSCDRPTAHPRRQLCEACRKRAARHGVYYRYPACGRVPVPTAQPWINLAHTKTCHGERPYHLAEPVRRDRWHVAVACGWRLATIYAEEAARDATTTEEAAK